MLHSLVALLAVTSALGEVSTDAEKAVEVLRGPNVVDIGDAGPLESERVEGEVLVANRTPGGEPGFVLIPEIRVGTPWKLELGAAMVLKSPAGEESTSGAASVVAEGQIVAPGRYVPRLSLKGRLIGPLGEAGVSAEAMLLATKHFGLVRVHGNAGYLAIQDAADEYLLGVAVDRPLGTRVLVKGDTYYLRPLGEEAPTLGAGVGAGVRLGQALVLTGAVNLTVQAEDVGPRLLLGVYGIL